jgi:hypothetical protein
MSDTWAVSCYAMNLLVFAKARPEFRGFDGAARLDTSFADGTSNTVMLAEKLAVCADGTPRAGGTAWAREGPQPWQWMPIYNSATHRDLFQVQPSTDACSYRVASTAHSSGLQAALADGSVRTINRGISLATWQALQTPSDQDLLGPDW